MSDILVMSCYYEGRIVRLSQDIAPIQPIIML
jgi:hypothetical protein